MKNYILKTKQNDKIIITEKEYKGYLASKNNGDSSIFLKDKGITIDKNMIAIIYPENMAPQIEDRRKQQVGVLHDGQLVKKHFGQWVLFDKTAPDDNGNYTPVVIDSSYYPEILQNCVPSQEEFEKIKYLPQEERLKLILKQHKQLIGKRTEDMQKIGEINKKLKIKN